MTRFMESQRDELVRAEMEKHDGNIALLRASNTARLSLKFLIFQPKQTFISHFQYLDVRNKFRITSSGVRSKTSHLSVSTCPE